MLRRDFLFAAGAVALAPAASFATGDAIGVAFMKLSPAARRKAQEELQTAGFYEGKLDGAFGPGTRQAIVQAAAYVRDNSRGQAVYDVRSASGAAAFVRDLSNGDAAAWLYGEGGENDM